MLTKLRAIHLYAGWLFVLIFALTGQYMRHIIHPAMEADPILRFSMRANHIYILLFGLVHLCLGAYWRCSVDVRRQKLQLAGSVSLLIATVLVIAAFFFEPKIGAERPTLLAAMHVAVVGVGLHLLSVRNTSHQTEEQLK